MSVLIAARESGKLFPMMTTAAGTIPPAKVLILGAGVAGLQAIATAKRLGGVVTGFDVRSVVKEQVQSLGGRFLEVEAVKDAEGEGGYARPLTDEENEKLRGGARRGRQAPGRDHHDRADPRPARAAPDHRRRRQEHGARLRDHRPRRRDRRQRRGLEARRDRRGGRGQDHRPGQPAEPDGRQRLGALRQEPAEPRRADGRPRRGTSRSTPRTRSSPAPCSPRTARSSTREPRRPRAS